MALETLSQDRQVNIIYIIGSRLYAKIVAKLTKDGRFG